MLCLDAVPHQGPLAEDGAFPGADGGFDGGGVELDLYGYGYGVDVGVGDEGVEVAVGFGVLGKVVETDCLLELFWRATRLYCLECVK